MSEKTDKEKRENVSLKKENETLKAENEKLRSGVDIISIKYRAVQESLAFALKGK